MSALPEVHFARQAIAKFTEGMELVLAGKSDVIEKAMICLLSRGHLLIEDVPGVGKTTLAKGIASLLGIDFGRVQFTADLLPADILGAQVFDQSENTFVFHPGPIFHHIVLADEINRATPKAQSALLQAMEEKEVSVDNDTHALPIPFFVLATQNPVEHMGTFPLPESQLDRFFMRIEIGYPDKNAEKRLLLNEVGMVQLRNPKALLSLEHLIQIQQEVSRMEVSEPVIEYLLEMISLTRNENHFRLGVSPRAGKDVLAAAKAHAWLNNEAFVSPADLQSVWAACLTHRVVCTSGDPCEALQAVLDQVNPPA